MIEEADRLGIDAQALLRLAAIEARQLYPELFSIRDPWPTNEPTPPRGVHLVAYRNQQAVGMGAHRPIDAVRTELRRLYVLRTERRRGAARAIVAHLEQHATDGGFEQVLLETGYKQEAAIRLYAACGYARSEAFGSHVGDATSVCFAKTLPPARGTSAGKARATRLGAVRPKPS